MQLAIELASQHHPHPNPRVGCVLVDASGDIIGCGAHVEPGQSHAERNALADAGELPSGVTAYVTLEPCSHHGRTPPCADALIKAGVERVVVATLDPDERVSGSGVERLRSAGIDVVVGEQEELARAVDPGYFHHRTTGRPLVHAVLTHALETISEAVHEDLDRIRIEKDHVVGGGGEMLAHPAAAGAPFEAQLAQLAADGLLDLGIRDDETLMTALAADGLIDLITTYTESNTADWGPLTEAVGSFSISAPDTIGAAFRHDARKMS